MKAVTKLAYLALTFASTTHAQDLRGAVATNIASKGVLTSETLSSSGFILDEMDDEDREYLLEFQEIMEMDGEEEGKPKQCRGKKLQARGGIGCHNEKTKRVCGCNGKSYRNSCVARRHNTRVRRMGRCKKEDEIIDAEASAYKLVAEGFLPEDMIQESSASSFSDESEDYESSDFSDDEDEDEEEMDEIDEGLDGKKKCTPRNKSKRCKRIRKCKKAKKCMRGCFPGRSGGGCWVCGVKKACGGLSGDTVAALDEELYEEEEEFDSGDGEDFDSSDNANSDENDDEGDENDDEDQR